MLAFSIDRNAVSLASVRLLFYTIILEYKITVERGWEIRRMRNVANWIHEHYGTS